jgi:sialate O-acetylesterase
MKKSISAGIFLAGSFLLIFSQVSADVKLPKILGSNIVLQRNREIKIWGWADKGEKVTVHFNDAVESTRADRDGNWMISLPAMKAGGPYGMKIRGRNIIELENVLIGDVWICSGQSNMEFPEGRSRNAEEEAAGANYHGMRLFTVPNNAQSDPAADIPGAEWVECNPETVIPFSAVGYFFGRDIHRELKIPVGLISSNWGGTVIETWISMEAIRTVPDFKDQVEELSNFDVEKAVAEKRAELKAIVEKYAAKEPGIQNGHAVWADPDLDLSGWGKMELPALWETRGMEGLDGIVWFRRTFSLPADVAGRGITLSLGPIDDSDMTWVNGKKVGETIQRYDQDRNYHIPPEYLKEGRNVIAVRVEDTGGGGGIWGDPEKMKVRSEEFEIPLAG